MTMQKNILFRSSEESQLKARDLNHKALQQVFASQIFKERYYFRIDFFLFAVANFVLHQLFVCLIAHTYTIHKDNILLMMTLSYVKLMLLWMEHR